MSWSHTSKAEVPVRCDGSGTVIIGPDVVVGFRPAPRLGSGEVLLQARGEGSVISIGGGSKLSNNVSIVAEKRISVGQKCLIGDSVCITDTDAHPTDPLLRHDSSGEVSEVIIGDNVWLGSRVMVLKGSSIGDNSVIAACAVVTGSIPANVIAAGVPATVIRPLK